MAITAIFGREICPLTKVPEGEDILSFYPRVLKLSLVSLYTQPFLRYGSIAIFGHEICPLAKVPEVAHIPSLYPRGVEIELIFALRAAVSKIRANFQNCNIWA